MRTTAVWVAIGLLTAALIVSVNLIKGYFGSPPSFHLALMLGQVIEFNAVPFCVGGACFLFKRKLEVFFTGWLLTFLIFGFGAIYQASLRTSPIARATASARKMSAEEFLDASDPSANSADIVAPTPTPTRASEVAKMAFPSTVLVFIEDLNGQPLSIGSGFVLDTGAVVTNLHVIEAGGRGYVKEINSNTKHVIDGFLRADALHDLAVLSVPSLAAPKLKLAGDTPVAVGDTVYAVGNPRGLEGTFSQGIISAIRRVDSDTIFQITAPISPGSSGGPVLNDRGEVIGIAFATFTGGQNLNFAVPSSYLERVAMLAKPAPLAKLDKKKTSSVLTAIGGRERPMG